jgi:hypothetical protein
MAIHRHGDELSSGPWSRAARSGTSTRRFPTGGLAARRFRVSTWGFTARRFRWIVNVTRWWNDVHSRSRARPWPLNDRIDNRVMQRRPNLMDGCVLPRRIHAVGEKHDVDPALGIDP